MFWRLCAIQAAITALAIGLAGVAIIPRGDWGRLLVLMLVGALTAFLPALQIRRLFLEPLRKLAEAARKIGEGTVGGRVYVGQPGEVRTLEQSLNVASEQLADRFAQLEDDRRQLRAVLSGLIEGVVSMDAGQRIIFVNDRAGQLLELSAERAVGKRFFELVRQRPILEVVARAAQTLEPQRADIDWIGNPNRSFGVYAAPLANSAGLILVLHDTTEIKRLESLRQDFVANVSHELKTPIAVIQTCVETLIDGALDDAEHRGSFLDQIVEQTHRLHHLILDLIHLGRVESGSQLLEPEKIDLAEAVGACLERHHARAAAHHHTMTMTPAAEPTSVWIDSEVLQTILDNLIDNAIKYTPHGGKIEVRWGGPLEGPVWLEVSDTGIGIPERDLPRIFERFYRVDKARSRELGGTGLGLAIVKHLAQACRGSVQAESTLGEGTTITVTLPKSGQRSGVSGQ